MADKSMVGLIPPVLFAVLSGVQTAMFVADGKPFPAGMAVTCGLLCIVTTAAWLLTKRS